LQLRCEVRLHQDFVAPHVDDLRDVLDEDGAVLHAVHAVGAVPYLGHADAVVDEVFLGLGNGGRSPPWPAAFFASTYSCALSSQWSFKSWMSFFGERCFPVL